MTLGQINRPRIETNILHIVLRF